MVAMKSFISLFSSVLLVVEAGRIKRMDSSIIELNGKLGMYLNIPNQCSTVYDAIIEKLEACKTGFDLGHPSLDQGCLVQVKYRKFICSFFCFQKHSSALHCRCQVSHRSILFLV